MIDQTQTKPAAGPLAAMIAAEHEWMAMLASGSMEYHRNGVDLIPGEIVKTETAIFSLEAAARAIRSPRRPGP